MIDKERIQFEHLRLPLSRHDSMAWSQISDSTADTDSATELLINITGSQIAQ